MSTHMASKFHTEIHDRASNVVNMTQFDEAFVGRLNGHMTATWWQMDRLMMPNVYLALGAPRRSALHGGSLRNCACESWPNSRA